MKLRSLVSSLALVVLGLCPACLGETPSEKAEAAGSGGMLGTGGSGVSSGGVAAGGTLSGAAGGADVGTGGEGQGIGGTTEACSKPRESGMESIEMDVDGTMRRFLLYVPVGYDASTRLPLVFNLHPSGSNPEDHMSGTDMAAFADSKQFFVASMAAIEGKWNVLLDPERPSEVDFASKIIEYVEQQVCLDSTRIYSTGFSGGARTSSLLACALTDQISAIAPVAGLRNDPPCDGAGVSVLALHGSADGVNYYDGCPAGDDACSRNGEWAESVESALADWRVSNGCAGEPELEVLDGGVEHRSWRTCTAGNEVEFYKIPEGQHVWWLLPDTTNIVTDFLLAH